MNQIDHDAQLVYEYHHMDMPLKKADAIFCLCSMDTRVADRAVELWREGYGKLLIFSGGSGVLTEGLFDKPEAEAFADIARRQGVPDTAMLVEPKSTNTGENVRFTYELLDQAHLTPTSFVLVQKPYMERRTYATFMKQWPGEAIDFCVTSPQLTWANYPNDTNPREFIISVMVGDLIRIREYPAKGFQITQDIPEKVWEAGQRLIAAGYTAHLP